MTAAACPQSCSVHQGPWKMARPTLCSADMLSPCACTQPMCHLVTMNSWTCCQVLTAGLLGRYIHAFQSWLWNGAASARCQSSGIGAPIQGDLVLPLGGGSVVDHSGTVYWKASACHIERDAIEGQSHAAGRRLDWVM